MSFTFYGCFDQHWIDTKINQYSIDSFEIIGDLEEYCYDAKQILNSPNPVIYCLINQILSQFISNLESNYDFSSELLEKIRENLEDTIFINAFDSHLQTSYVFENLKEAIIQELVELEIIDQFEELKNLFEKYDF
jgi:hypothetical protein